MVAIAGLATALIVQESRWRSEAAEGPANLQIAKQEFRAGDEKNALALFQKLAAANDPAAQYWVGHMTELGIGIPRDVSKAIALYQEAAVRNNVAAQVRLGEIYLHGDLVPSDFTKAKGYLERAANIGNARAALLLGQMYRLGLGMPANPKEACIWSEVSTIEGNALARHERDALMPILNADDQKAVSTQARAILASITEATKARHSQSALT